MNTIVAQNWDWLLVVLVLILIRFWRPALPTGQRGELRVNAGLSRLLDQKVFRLITNVTLPVGNDTTQIDHLIVSPYGIFVIETKNFSGWIFGHPNDAQWTQVLYRSKERFQNPLHQNDRHVRVLTELLSLPSAHVYNVVAFVGACTFKTPMPVNVVRGVRELAAFIQENRAPMFTENEVSCFIDVIQANRLDPGAETDRIHLQNVRRKIFGRTSLAHTVRYTRRPPSGWRSG